MQNILNKVIKFSILSLIFLLPLFFLPFSFDAWEINKQYLVFFLSSASLLAWLGKMIFVDEEIRIKKNLLNIFVLSFLLITLLSSVFSVDRYASFFGFYGKFFDGFFSLLSLSIFYFVLSNNIDSGLSEKKDEAPLSKSILIKSLLISSAVSLLVAYLGMFNVFAKIAGFLLERFGFSVLVLPAYFNTVSASLEGFAMFLSVIFVFIVGLISSGFFKNVKTISFYAFFLLASFLFLFLIDFTPAWIVIVGSLGLFLIVALSKKMFSEKIKKLLFPIFLVLFSFGFIFVNTNQILRLFFSDRPEFLGFQKELVLSQSYSWEIALSSAVSGIKNFLLGSGPGTFFYNFTRFKPPQINQTGLWQVRFDRAGNYLSETLGVAGFLGLLSYLAIVGLAFLGNYWLNLRQKIKDEKNFSIAFFIGFSALIAGQLFYYQNTVLALMFWLFLAMSVSSLSKDRQSDFSLSLKDSSELSLLSSSVFILIAIVTFGLYFFTARFYLADIYYRRAFFGKPIANLQKAVRLNPYQSQYKIVLAGVYLDEVLVEVQKKQSEQDLNALSNNIYLALTYAKSGQIGDEAIKGAVEVSPNRVAAWETLALIYKNINGLVNGTQEHEMSSLVRAAELEPQNPVFYTEIGKLQIASNDLTRARESLSRAKILKPDYVDALVQEVLILERENNLGEAVSKMKELALAYAYDADILFQAGRLVFNNGKTTEAIVYLEKAVTLSPGNSNAHYSLGLAYERLGEISKALVEFEKVLQMNPNNEEVAAKINTLR